jgi:hypothetical protein
VALCDKYDSQNKDGRLTKEEKDPKQELKPVIIVDCKVICFNSTFCNVLTYKHTRKHLI